MRQPTVLVAIALFCSTAGTGTAQQSATCPGDIDGDNQVAINELISSVGAALEGCPRFPMHRLGDSDVIFQFSTPDGFYNIDQTFMIGQKAPNSSWGIHMPLGGDADPAAFAQIAVKTGAVPGQDSVSFLVTGGASLSCAEGTFDGSCRAAIDLQQGHYYRFRVWRLAADHYGVLWGAWLSDDTNGTVVPLGSITAPPGLTALHFGSNFAKYGGPERSCSDVPLSVVYWTPPTANNDDDTGIIGFVGSFSNYVIGLCAGGSIDPYDFDRVSIPGPHAVGGIGVRSALGGTDPLATLPVGSYASTCFNCVVAGSRADGRVLSCSCLTGGSPVSSCDDCPRGTSCLPGCRHSSLSTTCGGEIENLDGTLTCTN